MLQAIDLPLLPAICNAALAEVSNRNYPNLKRVGSDGIKLVHWLTLAATQWLGASHINGFSGTDCDQSIRIILDVLWHSRVLPGAQCCRQ